MGIIIRQSIKSSVGYYLGVILGAVNTLFIATHFLSTDQLAVSRILLENSLIFAAFIHLGAPHISDKFFARFKDESTGHNGILGYLMLFPLVGCVFLGIIYFIFEQDIQNVYLIKSPSLISYLWLSLPMSLGWALVMILEAYTRANSRVAVPTFLRETVFRILNISLIIVFRLGWISFNTFMIFNVLAIFLIVVSLLIYLKILKKLFFNLNFLKIKKALFIDSLKFGGLVIIGGLGVNLILFFDRNIIAQKIGTEAVAIFLIASYIASTIEIPGKALKSISSPVLSENMFNNKIDKVEEIYQKSALNLMLIGGIMLVLIVINIESILLLLPKHDIYVKGKWIVILIALGKWVEMSLGLNNEIITFSKYYKFNTLVVICMTIFVVFLNYYFIPIFGLIGSALATLVVTLSSSLIRLFFVKRFFGFSPFSLSKLFVLIIFSVLIIIGMLIPEIESSKIWIVSSIMFKSLLILLLFFFIIIRYNISQDISYLYLNAKKNFNNYFI